MVRIACQARCEDGREFCRSSVGVRRLTPRLRHRRYSPPAIWTNKTVVLLVVTVTPLAGLPPGDRSYVVEDSVE